MKKLIKLLVILLVVSFVLGMTGSFTWAGQKELTPFEWNSLSTKEKLEYKTVKITDFIWAKSWMEEKTKKNFDEIMHTGDVWQVISMYSKALFELYHPKVRVEGISYNQWKGMQVLGPDIVAGTAPSLYVCWDPVVWIKKGLLADITDLVKDWDQAPFIQSTIPQLWEPFWVDGRCYGIPDPTFIAQRVGGCIAYRKDFFKEVGIYNEKGKPGPPEDWTWSDLRKIAKKLTNEKKKRWGYFFAPSSPGRDFDDLLFSYGVAPNEYAVPDKSGKYTWQFRVTPQWVKALKFLKDMRWEDNSLDTSIDYVTGTGMGKEMPAGRVAMVPASSNWVMADVINNPFKYSATTPSKEIVGWVNLPKGPYGLRLNTIAVDPYGFNPAYNKEQLKAAFEWMDWNAVGRGKTLALEFKRDLLAVNMMYYPWVDMLSQSLGGWYFRIREVPKGIPPVTEIIPEEYLESLDKGFKIPAPPTSIWGPVGLVVSGRAEMAKTIIGVLQSIMTNRDVDIRKELKKAADYLNTSVLNEKVENDREKLKEYALGLSDFYKEYYPEWFNSTEYKQLFEEYYKFW